MTEPLRSTMGLFGKIPSKRDFVTVNMPNGLLHPWEAWLQAGMTAGAAKMESAWREAFLVAPIWRFWLGAKACGDAQGCERRLGVMMPSIDAVGRYFPLTVFARTEEAGILPGPATDLQEEIFEALEAAALAALDHGSSLEGLVSALNAGPMPHTQERGLAVAERLGLLTTLSMDSPATAMSAIADALLDEASFWWTAGGEGFKSQAFAAVGLPSSDAFLAFVATSEIFAEDDA